MDRYRNLFVVEPDCRTAYDADRAPRDSVLSGALFHFSEMGFFYRHQDSRLRLAEHLPKPVGITQPLLHVNVGFQVGVDHSTDIAQDACFDNGNGHTAG